MSQLSSSSVLPSSLGIYAKLPSALPSLSFSGVMSAVLQQYAKDNADVSRTFERFFLMSLSQGVMASAPSPSYKRLVGCCRWKICKTSAPSLKFTPSSKAVRYGDLQTCGSVWSCPVCSARISNVRTEELKRITSAHQKKFGTHSIVMITRTFSHKDHQTIGELMESLRKVEDVYKSGRFLKEFKTAVGILHTVRVIEITYGANGFHPHIHELLFLDKEQPTHDAGDIFRADIKARVFKRWLSTLANQGLTCSERRGVDVCDGSKSSAYLSKLSVDGKNSAWAIEDEMTKANTKKGRGSSVAPFDFLRILATDAPEEVRRKSAALWLEYVKATKGVRQLVYSRGLKAAYAVEEKDDADLLDDLEVQSEEKEALRLFTKLDSSLWMKALAEKRGRSLLLREAERWLKEDRGGSMDHGGFHVDFANHMSELFNSTP